MTETETESKKKTRSFKVKINVNDKANGRYTGDSPYQAANKALSEIIRKKVKEGVDYESKTYFTMIESTKNSKHKEHQYEGSRIKLDKPIKYTIKNGTVIVKKYKNKLRKLKKSELNN